MVTDKSQRLSWFQTHPAAVRLALASAVTCAFIVACRVIEQLTPLENAELDGFIFVAALYWIAFACGSLAPRSWSEREAPRGLQRPASIVRGSAIAEDEHGVVRTRRAAG